jgi:HlyD family secretion protein
MMLAWIKRNKYLLGFLIAVIAIGYFGYGYYKSSTEVKETVRTATVEYGHLSDSISATGSLSAVDNVDISSKITGRIVEVCVEENDHVNAGQVLVRLDDTSLAATQTQMQAKMENALATYNRYSALLAKGAISKSDYDLAEADYTVAKANYDQATSNVNDTVITTPISGYVIGKPTPVGQTISSGISEPQVIMSIANLDNMQIETMVDESDIGQVKVGQKVNFTVDSYPDRTFEGIVRLVSRKAVTENNVIYYTVYVDVANSEGKLLPTMTARANIIVNEADGVLMVPANCLRTEASRYVQVYNEATKEIRNVDVEVGLSGDDKVAVSSPELKEGDKILVKAAKATQTNSNRMGGPPMH